MDTQPSKSRLMDKIPPFIKVKWESGAEDIHYSVNYEEVPQELRFRYEEELKETPEKRENGLSRLKEIIEHEKLENLSDVVLLAILRSSKFNPKRSESKLRNFIVDRRKILKKLAMIDLNLINIIVDATPGGFLPYRDNYGRGIFYVYPHGVHLDKFSMGDILVMGYAVMLLYLSFELSTMAGVVFFVDCKTPSKKIALQFLNELRKLLPNLLSFPVRTAKIEVFNEFSLVWWMFKVLRPLFPDKIAKRFNFNGNHENLLKSYHPDLLPEEFGGTTGRLSTDFGKQQFFEFLADLMEETKTLPS